MESSSLKTPVTLSLSPNPVLRSRGQELLCLLLFTLLIISTAAASLFPPPLAHWLFMEEARHSSKSLKLRFFKWFSCLLRFLEIQVALPKHVLHQLLGFIWLGYVVVKVHSSWADFQNYFRQQEGEKRLLAFTKRATKFHSDFSYRRGDFLIFGSETSGLPPEALEDCKTGTFGGGTLRIPMVETYVRCLNLSVSVGIALYASRQLNYEQLQQLPLANCIDSEHSIITEDIFA